MSSAVNDLIAQEDEDTQQGKILTFKLDNEVYGIEIKNVTEIIGIQPITFIPEVPPYVKGIINLRGKIIPVIDVRLKFKKQPKEYNDRTCIIVIDMLNVSIGLIVDSVSEVLNISGENIAPPPSYRSGAYNRYIKGIGKVGNAVILLLDCEKIINENELEAIGNIA